MEYLAFSSGWSWLCLAAAVAVVYFPVCWLAAKLGGERGLNIAIVGMVAGVFCFLSAIPVAFYLFLRYGL